MVRKIENEYIDCGDYYKLIITGSKHRDEFCVLIDIDDYNYIKQRRWVIQKANKKVDLFYVVSTKNKNTVLLHRYVMKTTSQRDYVDHINGDTLDNRKENLREVTPRNNSINRRHENDETTSGYRGIFWCHHLKTPKWMAHIEINGKRKHLGYFDTYDRALEARQNAEIEYFGEFNRQQTNLTA